MERGFRISTVWAFISLDPSDNCEGIIAMQMDGTWVPLIGADLARAESLRPYAKAVAHSQKRVVRLVRFDTMTEVESYDGTSV